MKIVLKIALLILVIMITVTFLLSGTSRTDSENQKNAESVSDKNADPKEVERLLILLQNESEKTRAYSAETLGRIKAESAVEPLIDRLKNDTVLVQISAAYALGLIGDARAVDTLIETLKQKHSILHENAAIALGKIGDPRAVKPLTLLYSKNYTGMEMAATRVFSDIGTKAVPPLIEILKDEKDADVRKGIADALNKITSKKFGDSYELWQKWWNANKTK